MAPLKQSDRKKKRSDEKKKKQKLIIGESDKKKKKLIIGESDKGKKKRSDEKKKKQKLTIGESDKGKKKQSDKKEKKKMSDMEMIEARKRIEEEKKVLNWELYEAGYLPRPRGGPPAALLRSWPELVGLTGEEAKAKIMQEQPKLKTVEVPPDGGITFDYRLDRVWIYVDSDGKVDRAPKVG